MKKVETVFWITLCMAVLVFEVGISTAKENQQLATIGTGGVGGVYYQSGIAVADLVNIDRK